MLFSPVRIYIYLFCSFLEFWKCSLLLPLSWDLDFKGIPLFNYIFAPQALLPIYQDQICPHPNEIDPAPFIYDRADYSYPIAILNFVLDRIFVGRGPYWRKDLFTVSTVSLSFLPIILNILESATDRWARMRSSKSFLDFGSHAQDSRSALSFIYIFKL